MASREQDREPRDKEISSPVRTPVYLTKELRKLAITMFQEDVCMAKKDEDNTFVLSTDSSIGRQCHTVTQETLDTLVEFHGFRDKSRTTKAALFQKGCRHEACSTGLVSLSTLLCTSRIAMVDCQEEIRDDICIPYQDDIIMYSKAFEEQVEKARTVLRHLRKRGNEWKPSKCHLFQSEVCYLGSIVS